MTPISQQTDIKYTYAMRFDRLKLVFVEIPKCGSTGLKKLLLTLNRDIPYKTSFGTGFVNWSVLFPESLVPDLSAVPDDFERATMVRNPFKRLASGYRDRWLHRHPDDSFDDMMKAIDSGEVYDQPLGAVWNNHFRPCAQFVPRDADGNVACKVFKLEKSEEFVDFLNQRLDEKDRIEKLPVVNTSKPKSVRPVEWTDSHIETVRRVFAEDFPLGDYSLDPE